MILISGYAVIHDIHLWFKATDETKSQLHLWENTLMLDMGECLPFIKTVYSCVYLPEPHIKHLPRTVCLS